MKKNIIITGVVLAVVVATGASAATHYIITSVHQIKPGVVKQIRGPKPKPSGITAIKEVRAPQLTLADGQSTVDVGGMNWEADCPAGYSVIGTGFDDGGIGEVGFVESFGTFVGGIIFNFNGNGIPIQVELEAICGKLQGSRAALAQAGGLTAYHALLTRAERAHG